ncbi:MAG: hypothetical protein QM783_16330 [Phycisphaerales bacterium]
MTTLTLLAAAAFAQTSAPPVPVQPIAATTNGYYRQPAIHGDTIAFVAEGDIWTVPVSGGRATRLTTHPGPESQPAISPDGKTIAFLANYEDGGAGARENGEVYTMPIAGGLPVRRTWGGAANAHDLRRLDARRQAHVRHARVGHASLRAARRAGPSDQCRYSSAALRSRPGFIFR